MNINVIPTPFTWLGALTHGTQGLGDQHSKIFTNVPMFPSRSQHLLRFLVFLTLPANSIHSELREITKNPNRARVRLEWEIGGTVLICPDQPNHPPTNQSPPRVIIREKKNRMRALPKDVDSKKVGRVKQTQPCPLLWANRNMHKIFRVTTRVKNYFLVNTVQHKIFSWRTQVTAIFSW